jgi:hypothetical protein
MMNAERIARRMIALAFDGISRAHFCIIADRVASVPVHWKRKNMLGVSFRRDEQTEAVAWVRAALMAGHAVCRSPWKRGPFCGRSLADGDYLEDRGS